MPPVVVKRLFRKPMGSSLNEQPPGKSGGCSLVAFFNSDWFFVEKALLLRKLYSP
jgi:hypothetical protein